MIESKQLTLVMVSCLGSLWVDVATALVSLPTVLRENAPGLPSQDI